MFSSMLMFFCAKLLVGLARTSTLMGVFDICITERLLEGIEGCRTGSEMVSTESA